MSSTGHSSKLGGVNIRWGGPITGRVDIGGKARITFTNGMAIFNSVPRA